MASCQNEHKYLINGAGLCSKPEFVHWWFCEKRAFGNSKDAPFLACPEHGGPAEPLSSVEQDEVNATNQWRSENRFAAFMKQLGPEGRKNVTVL